MRKLTAIVFADIVGFTAMMGKSEERAFETLERTKATILPLIKKFNGKFHKELGDGYLMSFLSSWNALQCALEIQEELKNDPDSLLRIGVHSADVSHSKGDILGDGVNITFRIQEMAKPGGVCISSSVYNSIKNKEGVSIKSIGLIELKNIDELMELYHVANEYSLDIFRTKLAQIEEVFENEKYVQVVYESVELMEKSISIFISYFHTSLKSKGDRIKYLEFEKLHGDNYLQFIKKPEINYARQIFEQLTKIFPDNAWLNPRFSKYLNIMSVATVSVANNNDHLISKEEAGKSLDALEGLLRVSKLYSRSVEVVGFHLKYFLAYKTIKERYETSKSSMEFRRIISDSRKVLIPLLETFINKLYNEVSIEQKEVLVNNFKPCENYSAEEELKHYYDLIILLNIYGKVPGVNEFLFSMDEALESKKDPTFRSTRHYIKMLDFVIGYNTNPSSIHILEYADELRIRFLTKKRISQRDRKQMLNLAYKFEVSQNLGLKLLNMVEHIVDKELYEQKIRTKPVGYKNIFYRKYRYNQPLSVFIWQWLFSRKSMNSKLISNTTH